LGAILGGEFTEGARKQLTSHNINILYIPYRKIVEAFLTKGINLDYPEDATNRQKLSFVGNRILDKSKEAIFTRS
jgi:hypothetical protein